MKLFYTFFLLSVSSTSCVGGLGNKLLGRDGRSIIIQSLNFFDQNQIPEGKDVPSWRADWIFRRERLLLLDQSLRENKPDILILQDTLQRPENPADSDEVILSRGALTGFEYESFQTATLSTTGEEKYLAIAVSLPSHIKTSSKIRPEDSIVIYSDASLSIHLVDIDGQELAIFNISALKPISKLKPFYLTTREMIRGFIEKYNLCQNRLVVAGYLPGSDDNGDLNSFLDDLNLIDITRNACGDRKPCSDRTEKNQIAELLSLRHDYPKIDRLLVSSESSIVSASRAFVESTRDSTYSQRFNITDLPISWRSGWNGEFRFAKCDR